MREESLFLNEEEKAGKRYLKPCPFCGWDEPRLEKKGRTFINGVKVRSAFVRCPSCNAIAAKISCDDYPTRKEAYDAAVEAWNNRTAEMFPINTIGKGDDYE